ncbi:MAG: hypothetical protein ACJ79K_03920 [Gemmatimonadaceae bacterium]
MVPRRGFFRAIVMLWAVLQLAVPTLAVSADAVATTASIGAHAHVEATTDASCIRVHDAECVFCQFLATGAAPAASPVPDVPGVVDVAQAFDELAAPHRGALRGIANPRAPPAV